MSCEWCVTSSLYDESERQRWRNQLLPNKCRTYKIGYHSFAFSFLYTESETLQRWKGIMILAYLIPVLTTLHVLSPSTSPLCSSPRCSCCRTMLYTLALSSVNTVVVFLSRPRNASRISFDGLVASSAKIPESCRAVSRLSERNCRRETQTLSRFPTRFAYSSRTSCSSGLSSSSPFVAGARLESVETSMVSR